MRRNANGVLLPGILFTIFASVGVVLLFVVGMPALPETVRGLRISGDQRVDGTASVEVPVATPTPKPTTAAPRTPTATPTTVPPTTPSRVPEPTRTRTQPPPPTRTRVAPPPVVSCKAGSAVLTPAADAYVDQESPRKNFGDSENLFVASRHHDRNRRALVRFALPKMPAGCTLRGATLTLSAKEATGRKVRVSRAGKGWNESTVTWATAPAPAGTAATMTVNGPRVTWTVTGMVRSMLGGANYGFLLRDASESENGDGAQTNFGGRNARQRPTLTLRWS